MSEAQFTIARLERELAASNEYVRQFCHRLGVTHPEGGANVAEVALCRLDGLLAQIHRDIHARDHSVRSAPPPGRIQEPSTPANA